jgi:hypothetical protein
MENVNRVGLTNVVATAVPLTCTMESAKKFVPAIEIVGDPTPITATLGSRLLTIGAGLLTANVAVDEVPPPGGALIAVRERLFAVDTSAAVSVTATWVALT